MEWPLGRLPGGLMHYAFYRGWHLFFTCGGLFSGKFNEAKRVKEEI